MASALHPNLLPRTFCVPKALPISATLRQLRGFRPPRRSRAANSTSRRITHLHWPFQSMPANRSPFWAASTSAEWIVIGFALGSIALALALGYAISWSLLGPVKKNRNAAQPGRRRRLHSAHSSRQSRRAGHIGSQCEQDVRRTGTPLRADRSGKSAQVAVPREHEPRAAHAA